jgi:hypothetical protein
MAAGIAPRSRYKPFWTFPDSMTTTATDDMTTPKAAFRQLQTRLLIR